MQTTTMPRGLQCRCQLNGVAPIASRPAAVRRSRRALQTRALLSKVPAAPADVSKKLPVLSLISANVETQAQVQNFEVLAGRSAMIGFIVALAAELSTEHSIFNPVQLEQALQYGGAILAAVAVAAVAAAAGASRASALGAEIREAVITSLTAAQRSAASVTGRQVDGAVDYVLTDAFDTSVIYNLLDEDDILP